MNKALVTGAAGFLGKHIALDLKRKGFDVTGMGHGKLPAEERGAFGINEWRESGITLDSLAGLRKKFNLIVHCAGSGSVGYSLSHPGEDFDKTVISTLAVLEYMRLFNKDARLIYPSSAAVYGRKDDRPLSENEPLSPISPYGCHKKIVEELCKSYSDTFGMKVSIARFFSLYGEGLKKQLLWDTCEKFSRGDESVEFFGSGDETRDWLNVLDATKLILALSEVSERFCIVNGGSGERVTIKETIDSIGIALDVHRSVRFNGDARKGDPTFYRADITLALSLGWKPLGNWRQGVLDYVKWYRGENRK